jgi:hypothetical protein
MRAASRQSAIFYDKLPRNVDLIMSPSNIGDKMNYLPQDVLSDLSYTEVNPIKAVYTNYTCDTGQRMWDTNCLVNAVEGDASYHLSPRGVVTFVDKGEESLMLFEERPDGNARYQIPGDSYYNELKLMDIRRHNRMNKYPAPYTTEAPQPQLTGLDARAWAKPRTGMLADKYLGSAGNTLDPDGIRKLFEPIGFNGTNVNDYNEAVALLEDTLYTTMLNRAIRNGKTDLVIITGAPASGKTTALRQLMNYMPRRLEPAGTCPVYEPPTADDVARLKANRLGRKKQIVLVDEPPSEMLQRLQQMAAEGLTVIVSTDDEGLLHAAHEVVRLQN